MSKLLYSSMITPDGTVLVSRHVHDFVSHHDANGVFYMLDGGLDYIRFSGDGQQKWIRALSDSLPSLTDEELDIIISDCIDNKYSNPLLCIMEKQNRIAREIHID